MEKNLNKIAKELFGKIRTQFSKIKLGDEESNITTDPEQARFFDFEYIQDGNPLGNVSISLSADDGLVVIYSAGILDNRTSYIKKGFFNFLRELREFAKKNLLNFDTRDIAKSNLEKRDYEYLSQKIGESQMTESKLYGTSMTSYQQLGDTKLIVKHSAPVNSEIPTGRAQKINSIYIENSQGERFKYPYKHLNGARALAQHIGHGGTPYDSIGKHVIGLSEEMNKLRMFKGYVDRNPTISENVGAVRNKVAERIEEIKKQISDLQHPSRYETFAESFEEQEVVQIPEEIVNDWIDRLTIRTFNEELKNVFPYILKLIDESDLPIKELGADDLLADTPEISQEDYTNISIPEFSLYEKEISKIIGESTDMFSEDPQVQGAAVEKLNQLIAQEFPVGADGSNAIESLQGIIEDKELMDIFKELADVSPNLDVRNILKDYVQMKDEEKGTDIMSMLAFGEETPGLDAAPAAEPAPVAQAPAPVAQAPAPVAPVAEQEINPAEGNQFAQAVQKAKAAGMKPGDKFKVGGKEYTLQDAIERAGLTVEDFFGDKTAGMQGELVEFIKSMYNKEEGTFPKGETGVLIACEKKFGERAVPIAQKVVEKLTTLGEMQRIKQLSGLR
jgi:hypothetical protein